MPVCSMCGGQIEDVVSAGFCWLRMPQLMASQHHCPPSSSMTQILVRLGLVAGAK